MLHCNGEEVDNIELSEISPVAKRRRKYRGVRRIFSGGGQIFFVGGLSRFIGLRVHHNYGFMAIGYFMPRK